ncbi:phage integrase SAM-like domain-containing protein [Adhaeribacter soli]|uniref:Tyrosine-type recombinase/integrase n=1 Tax=Adhaeribacter soli TaxID=2607655 RepID=A0A5N1IXA8_9BACT|nr:phage integrase SAM-like domain-containing protein [Adhaeribacter soli]KAA9332693.1 hypothetical protein F0P94_11840 [Adhaeribacter soli]
MAKPIKTGSVKVTTRPSRDKQNVALLVRYTYDSKPTPFSLGITLKPSQFDDKKQQVVTNYPDSANINQKINQLKTDLLNLSNSLVAKNVEPTGSVVKAEYEHLIKEREIHAQKLKDSLSAKRAVALVSEMELIEIDEKATSFNNEIQIEKQSILDNLSQLGLNVNIDFSDDAKQFRGLIYEFAKEITGFPLTATKQEVKGIGDTAKHYRSWAKITLEFFKSQHFINSELPLSLQHLNNKFYLTYAYFLMDENGNDIKNNTFGSYIKRFKRFLNWVQDEKLIQIDPRYRKWKKLTEKKEVITLDENEIELLWNEPRNQEYRKTIDLMVFGCLTSLRISDIEKAGGFYVDGDGMLRGRTTKTDGDFMIPIDLDPRIKIILDRYNWNLKLWSQQEFNRQIKEVLFTLYVKHNIERRKINVFRKKLTEKDLVDLSAYKENLITAHSLRRTFVTRMFKGATGRKWRETEIMKMMGSTDIREFRKYLAIDATDIVEQVNEMKKE